MKQKLLSTMFAMTCISAMSFAQTREVSGLVTSSDGTPISGVSISVVGTNTATQTDGSGRFKISAPSGATLNVSYIGYTSQRVSIGNSMNLSIVLQSGDQALEEVVVTAMGVSRQKKSLTTATQEVKGDLLTQGANSNLATAMQGKVSGIEVTPSSGMPGASAKLTIRGSRSFTGNNQPLYVVDGMPISSTPDISTGNSVTGADYSSRGLDINPNDIESINVLKGQAASALYGMRASNGVIIITTKSGRGASKDKAQITFNSNVSFDKLADLPDFQTKYAQGSGGVYSPVNSLSYGPLITELPNDPTYGGNTTNANTTRDGMQPGKYYVQQRADAGLDPWVTPQAYNNVTDFLNIGKTINNSIGIQKAFDKGSYAFSGGATNSDGIVPSTGLDRYTAKLAANLDISDDWKTGFVGNFTNSFISKQTGANNGLVATLYGAPPSYDLKGITPHILGNPYSQTNYRSGAFDNVYWAVENNEFTEKTNRFFGNTFVQYSNDLNSDNQKLIFKYQLGADTYTTNYTDLWGYGKAGIPNGEIGNFNNSITEINSLFTAAYNWQINDDLVLDALIGNELVHRNQRYDYSYGANFNFSGWNSINNVSTYSSSQTLRKTRTVGTFGNLALGYKDMLFLNLTGRNDVVSTMPANNRSFFYPSISTAFVFTELDGVKNEVLTFGKLRLSYAEVGQAGDYYDSFYSTPAYGGGFSSGTPILYPIGSIKAYTPSSTLYDENLRPQNTKAYEIGTDLTFYSGLLNLNYTFSRQNVKDQIFSVPLGGSSGYSSLVTNGGRVHTNAHEVTLNVAPYREGNFLWDFTVNFTKIDNYVDELADGVTSIFLGGFTTPQVRAGIGDKYPVIYGTSYQRTDTGEIIVGANGIPLIGAEKVIGSVAPDFILGFNNTFEYKKLRLSALIDWKNGGEMYHATSNLMNVYGVSQISADVRDGQSFIVDGVRNVGSATSPVYEKNTVEINAANAATYYNTLSNIAESAVQSTSFVKLREISLGYPVYSKPGLALHVNAFARNLILWSELKGYDPEVSQGNNNMSGAFERFSLPGTSSYGFGLNIKF